MSLDRSCLDVQLLNAFVMLETELWLGITGLVILGGKQPQLSSKSCKVEIDGGGVWKRHADQMTTTGVGNGIEDEPVSMAVEPEWRLDRQVPEVLPDSSDTEPGDMPGKLTSVNSTSPLDPHQRRNHLDIGQLSPGLVILGGNQPQLGSKSCKVEIDGGGVWKRHADQMTTTGVGNGIEDEPVSMAVEPEWRLDRQDQMTTTGVGNGIEDEPVSMAVEPEWRLDRQVPEVLPDSSDTEPGDMPGKLTSVNSTSPLDPHQRRNHLDIGQLSPGLVILGGKQPQLGSKSCKVEIDGGGVWKRHADQMTTTGVGNGIEDEPGSMAVEPEWRLDRQGDSADQSYP
ncbi:hypothetical protein EMCRGX_G011544 [Ephydatia muelleri]